MTSTGFSVRFAHVLGEDHTFHLACVKLKDDMERAAGGRVSVEVYPNGSLGSEADLYGHVREGRIEIALISTVNARQNFPPIDALTLPYAFGSFREALGFVEAKAGQELLREFRSATGTFWLSFVTYGVRDIATVRRSVLCAEDMAAMTFRVPPNPIFVSTYKAFGAVPQSMALHEVLSALEAGTLDGMDIAPNALWRLKYHRVIRHMTFTGLFVGIAGFLASARWWDTLPEGIRDAIRGSALEAGKYALLREEEQTEEAMIALQREGITFHRPDPRSFRERADAVWDLETETIGAELIKAVRSFRSR